MEVELPGGNILICDVDNLYFVELMACANAHSSHSQWVPQYLEGLMHKVLGVIIYSVLATSSALCCLTYCLGS